MTMVDLASLPASVDLLGARGVTYALFARLLGEDPRPLVDGTTLDRLVTNLEFLGDTRALDRLGALEAVPPRTVDELSRQWVRWFDQGRIAPYECSNKPATVGGHTAPLADIAGFYRALDMRVSGDRPDHVVAELEFASLATLMEAQARVDGRKEDAAAAAEIGRTFLRDHLGVWLDGWAIRVLAIDPAVPWGPIAASAAMFVASDAARRNVIPVRAVAIFEGTPPDLPEEPDDLECGGEI